MKILIVEDEAIIAESLYQLLTMLEYEPLEPVQNPDDAIATIKQEMPQLAILDITLQDGRTGLEVADYIQSQKLRIPFIILSAHSDPATVAKVKKYGPAAYLVKPFRRESLFAAIEIAAVSEEDERPIEEGTEILLKTGARHEKLPLQELVYLKASGKYTELHFTFGKKLIRMSLRAFLENNTGITLLRTHKTYAVNPAFVNSFSSDEMTLGNVKVPIGRFFMHDVHSHLKKNPR
jgi:DNA-binding LytR/AlgR family response regulator